LNTKSTEKVFLLDVQRFVQYSEVVNVVLALDSVKYMFDRLSIDLFLQKRCLECEQELLDVVFPQLVDAASINGTT